MVLSSRRKREKAKPTKPQRDPVEHAKDLMEIRYGSSNRQCSKDKGGCGNFFPSHKQFMEHFDKVEGHLLGKLKVKEKKEASND